MKDSILDRIYGNMLWLFGKYQYKLKIIIDNPNPDQLKRNIIYIVGNKNYHKWIYMICPSGCGEVIMLSLNQEKSPSWSITSDSKGRPTIYPSIHKLDGCRSHFWIKKGKIKWV